MDSDFVDFDAEDSQEDDKVVLGKRSQETTVVGEQPLQKAQKLDAPIVPTFIDSAAGQQIGNHDIGLKMRDKAFSFSEP